MAKNEEPKIDVKLFVDKEKSTVVFAESGKEFVDILFSFLTLPIATIVRLLGKQSSLGCFDELYKSVESLSKDHFQTKACNTMLLHPINAAAKQCDRLTIKLDCTDHRAIYVCKDTKCCAHADSTISSVPDVVRKCGKVMQHVGEWPDNDGDSAAVRTNGDGIFVKGGVRFIITDDLQVAAASTSLMLSLVGKMGIRDPANLEERVLAFSFDKITSLLKRSLTSKKPLTGVCFDTADAPDGVNLDELHEDLAPKLENEAELRPNGVKIKLLQTRSNYVLYADAGGDFADILFRFLCFPLGSVIKMLGGCSQTGCIDNLYKSIDESAKGWIKSERQSLLLSPMLASYFGCGSNMLEVQQLAPQKLCIDSCFECFKNYGFSKPGFCRGSRFVSYQTFSDCNNAIKTTTLHVLNPKSPSGGREVGGAYIEGHGNFMVTDDLHVLPLSFASTLQFLREAKIPMDKLVEKEFTLTQVQVFKLLRAALVTRNALNYVFSPPKK